MSEAIESEKAEQIPRLSAWQLACYGALSMPLAMAGLALLTYLPTFFAVDMGLGLGLVGVLFVAGRLLDIFTDPLIGHLSDQTRSKWGARRPWMVAGIAGFGIACWLLFVPMDGAGALYLVLAGAAYFLFVTMLDIPYSSTGLEISPYVGERSRLASSKAAFQIAGAILAGAMPLILGVAAGASLPTIAGTIIVTSLIGLVLFLLFVPERPPQNVPPRTGLFEAIRIVGSDRRYRYLLGAFFIIQMANAFFTGLAVLYITYIVKAPELVGLFIGLMFVATAVFLPLWLFVARRFGKARCWQAGIAVSMIAILLAPLFGEGDIVAVCLIFAAVGATFGCDAVMPTSMLADIASDREDSGGGRLSGVYLSVKNATSKMSFVAPMGIAFPVLGYLNFETDTQHSETTLFVFLAFFALIPVLIKSVGILVLRRSPDFANSAKLV